MGIGRRPAGRVGDVHLAQHLDRPLPVIPGRPVDPAAQPVGCAYAARCPLASARCLEEDPVLALDATGARVACWHAGEIAADEPGRVALGTSA